MNDQFADWYAQAVITADRETLGRRWTGVEAAVAALTIRSLPDVCRHAHGLQPKAQDFTATFRAHFKQADQSFLMSGKNELELRILSGAVLIHQMTLDENKGLLAAMLAETVAFGGHREVVDAIGHATRAKLAKAGVSRRRLDSFPRVPKSTKIKEARKRLDSGQSDDLTALKDVAAASTEAVVSLVECLDRHQQVAAHNSRAASEESNILWWLCSAWSVERNVAFEKLGRDEAPFVLPLELATWIEIFPAPTRAAEVLKRAMQVCGVDPETLVAVAQARPVLAKSVLSSSAPTEDLSGLLPLSECDSTNERAASAIEVATQVLREIVVRRAYREWRDG